MPRKLRSFHVAKSVQLVLGAFCVALLCIDIVANNWELIDFLGDARHFMTPLLDTESLDAMNANFAFPTKMSPTTISRVGRSMVDFTITAVKMRDSSTYFLNMGDFLIQDATNDICGTLTKTYPVNATTTIGSAVRLGVVVDGVTYIRGDTLSRAFGADSTPAVAGSNASTLTAMGYIPGRDNADMRLTTPLMLVNTSGVTTLPMYRFFGRAFCTGCPPIVELGLTTCAIAYSFNDTTKLLTIQSSHATYGQSHSLGIIFERGWTPVLSLYVRLVCVLLVIAMHAVSQRTVQWPDTNTITWRKWLVNLVSPAQYLQPCRAFELSDICFNSDVYVLLYVIAVLVDEKIAMIYSRVLNNWYKNSSVDVLIQLRLMALSARWLWLNCFILKGLKWGVHFVSRTQYTGDNKVVGWCTFSSVSYVYLGVILLFFRNDFIEYGNTDNVTLSSTIQNIDAIHVRLFSSWYIRAMPPFVSSIFANLFVLLAVDHILHWRWWAALVKNSLGRQLAFNSTSILADVVGVWGDRPNYKGTVLTTKARALCTFRWFLATHLVRFGLAEHPSILRDAATSRRSSLGNAIRVSPRKSSRPSTGLRTATYRVPGGVDDGHNATDESSRGDVDWMLPGTEEDTETTTTTDVENGVKSVNPTAAADIMVFLQDRQGRLHLVDCDKREMQGVNMEVKILHNSTVTLG
ncbi:Aste57867_4971 [Aphanomyces stellatus]|uniref:Aste57867_4971 protein n=1 Tax=Aphanomyces stellatus TaxID=120398 RepID=A0A485KDW6_9STRA|nr:hypothetical protein As57867_004958 [Aphanomyces stellatus]VFT82059.1 Aste57867_4971 [Aphanomyces stellatus]